MAGLKECIMRLSLALVVCAVLIATTAGCITTSAGVAPSSMPLAQGGYDRMEKASGTSWGINILGFIPIKQAKTSSALEEAIRNGGGDALVELCVDNRACYLLVLNLQRIRVAGRGVKSK